MNTISTIILATKIHGAASMQSDRWILEAPRRREILWFIQWASLQPGGIAAMVKRMVEKFPERFQTETMLTARHDRQGAYSVAECLKVWADKNLCSLEAAADCIARSSQSIDALLSDDATEKRKLDIIAREALAAWNRADNDSPKSNLPPRWHSAPVKISFGELLTMCIGGKPTPRDAVGDSFAALALRAAVVKYNRTWLMKQCAAVAIAELPDYLYALCQVKNKGLKNQWFCLHLEQTLLDYIDLHAREVSSQIAETVITKTVRSELDFAVSECVAVPIVGESRYGKTKSVANWCQMYPGRARMVTIPESNNERDFIRAHADALNIEYSATTSGATLKDKVEFVIASAGLAIVYDEAHYAIPLNYNDATPPRRLNWIRAKLIDRGVATAFFATPQSYKQSLAKYAEETGYRIEQWLGRVAPAVILSDVIPVEEIIAVARTQFPEFSQAQLEELADRAIVSDGYLKSIELAGKRTRWLARQRGHDKPTAQDLSDACDEMMPASPRVVTDAPGSAMTPKGPARAIAPAQAQSSRIAEASEPDATEEFPRRSTRPKRIVNEPLTVG